MTHTYSAGRKALSPKDVGKDVVNSYGAHVGSAVEGTCREELVFAPNAMAAEVGIVEEDADHKTMRVPPENVELVTEDRIWLRL